MKILYIITGLGVAGAETQLIQLADRMHELQHEIIIVSLIDHIRIQPKHNITIHSLHLEKNPYSFALAFLKLRKLIKEFKPNVIHSHMFHANIFARLVRIMTDMPCLICTAHNTNEGGRIRMLCYRLTDRLATLSTNVSKAGVDEFINKGASYSDRMIPVYNGVDSDHFKFSQSDREEKRRELNLSHDKLMLLAVGRLVEQKDYITLLDSFKHLLDNYQIGQTCILYIVGEGVLHSDLVKYTHTLSLNEKVNFLGMRSDIKELMCAADIFIMSSQWEGFGLVLAEAMLCENIVVSTDTGGGKEVIGDNKFIVPIKSSKLLAEKINEMIELPDAKKKDIGKRNREYIITHFSFDSIIKEWLQIYKNYNVND